ncbi:MAG: GntR family transcriptional regulator [Planctomycetales bacterium]|nr:GntR family transcriptional regulator [Planctomycetales bacterium]
MFIQIEPANGLAIYDQVVRQFKFAVADTSLRPGERVPSVRDLAKQLAINPNTVARAYRQLQDDGVLETIRGLGLQVTSRALDHCRAERVQLIQQRLRNALGEALQSGLTGQEIQQLVSAELTSLESVSSQSERQS